MAAENIRNTVLNMLIRTLEKGEFSHLVLNETLAEKERSQKERAFLNRLFSGTLEKLVYLDYVLDSFSSVPVSKQKPPIRNLLRLSLYQIRFMDAVPSSAAVNEAVKIAVKRGFSNLKGFVNGVLRKAEREADQLMLPPYVEAFVPEWLYDLILTQYDEKDAGLFFREMGKEKEETCFWMNLLSFGEEQILKELEQDGCLAEKVEKNLNAWALKGFENLTELSAFRKGMIFIQDPSSMLAAKSAAALSEDPRLILDVCSAPGGKSLYLAQCFKEAQIVSRDLTEAKAALIRENVRRLHVPNIRAEVYDATVPDPSMTEKADLLVADLPCSGLGVIRKKPDILYRMKPSDLSGLCALQKKILETVQEYVRPGGILLFSTCTVNRKENQDNREWFLKHFPFTLKKEIQRLPGRDPFDGFYIAAFRRKMTSESTEK